VVTAWLGALAFTFQIYFDFSGYSHIALGPRRLPRLSCIQGFYRQVSGGSRPGNGNATVYHPPKNQCGFRCTIFRFTNTAIGAIKTISIA